MLIANIDADVIVYNVGFQTEDLEFEDAKIRTDLFINTILEETGATHFRLFLSDSKDNNFRYGVCPNYKANRTQPKPKWYEEIKEYLITEHGATIAYGMEADDALGINQSENTILCSIDKDLDQIPGKHYKWAIWRNGEIIKPSELYEVTEYNGRSFLWQQMLIGDTADNIKGIPRIGKVKAERLLEGLPLEDMEYIVQSKYKDTYGDKWEEEFNKNLTLLTILKESPDGTN
jgi:5'-3' exonuclease